MIRDFKEMLDLEIASGRFGRSPNSLCMEFTFLMDVNTSKYFLQLFYGNEANSNKSLKIFLNL